MIFLYCYRYHLTCFFTYQVNQLDGFHRSALHYAVEKSSECTQLLLQAGAETESRDLNRNTPLHWAAFRNRADCCRLLLQFHADVDARDRNDDTPLSWAAMKGNLESIRVLFEYNAQSNIMSHARMLPLTRVGILLDGGLYSEEDETCFELLTRGMGMEQYQSDSFVYHPTLLIAFSCFENMNELNNLIWVNFSVFQFLCKLSLYRLNSICIQFLLDRLLSRYLNDHSENVVLGFNVRFCSFECSGCIELRVRRAENPDALLLPLLLSRDAKLSSRLLDLCSAPRPLKALARYWSSASYSSTNLCIK